MSKSHKILSCQKSKSSTLQRSHFHFAYIFRIIVRSTSKEWRNFCIFFVTQQSLHSQRDPNGIHYHLTRSDSALLQFTFSFINIPPLCVCVCASGSFSLVSNWEKLCHSKSQTFIYIKCIFKTQIFIFLYFNFLLFFGVALSFRFAINNKIACKDYMPWLAFRRNYNFFTPLSNWNSSLATVCALVSGCGWFG